MFESAIKAMGGQSHHERRLDVTELIEVAQAIGVSLNEIRHD